MSIDRAAAFLGRQVVWLAILLFTVPADALASFIDPLGQVTKGSHERVSPTILQ